MSLIALCIEFGFIMCGTRVNAKPDICVMDGQDVLVVQEDKVSSCCLSIYIMSTMGYFTALFGCR